MKRILIFALLEPLLSAGVLILIASQKVGEIAYPDASVLLDFLVRIYLIGIIPALLMAFVDWSVAPKFLARIVSTAVAGHILVILAGLIFWGTTQIVEILEFGFVGSIPAAVCSWLASEKQNGRAA